jgi:hypothetical protein
MAARQMKHTLQLATAAALLCGLVLVLLAGCGPNNPSPPQIRADPKPVAGMGTFAGFTRDAETAVGLGKVIVRVRDGTNIVAAQETQANGRFFLTGIPPGAYLVDAFPRAGFGYNNIIGLAVSLPADVVVEEDVLLTTIFDQPPEPTD